MAYDHLADPSRASDYLADSLTRGNLVLFLGAGVSSGFGLPSWVQLINQARVAVGLPDVSSSSNADALQLAADRVRVKCGSTERYLAVLKSSLYSDIPELSSNALRNDLLTALGALMIGSRRGCVRRVVTLNFDSMLEWFLSLYGFISQVVYQLPSLDGSEDVRIYHPHGFLPHPSLQLQDSDFVIFDFKSVNERLGNMGNPWYELVRHVLRSGVCLFVGMSEHTFLDRLLAPLLLHTAKEVGSVRPVGLWLFKHSIDSDLRDQFLEASIAPIELGSAEEIVQFILSICQKAALNMRI